MPRDTRLRRNTAYYDLFMSVIRTINEVEKRFFDQLQRNRAQTYQCAPGKLCFEAGLSGNVSAAWAPETTAKGVCREFCRDTPHCCWFADAKTDCAACPPDHGCNPTASCFAEGPRVEL